jgi:hypothetical protein
MFCFPFVPSFDLIFFFARSEVFIQLPLFSTAMISISVIHCAVGLLLASARNTPTEGANRKMGFENTL